MIGSSSPDSTGKLRVRFSAEGGPEISTEDLRRTLDRDLSMLAETDLTSSTFIIAKGDGDGWVSSANVANATGLHRLVVAGFAEIVDAAKKSRAESIPVSRALELMRLPLLREQDEEKHLKGQRFEPIPFTPRSRGLIPALLRLKDYAKVPASLVTKHSVEAVARSVVARIGMGMTPPPSAFPDGELYPVRELRYDPKKPGLIQLYFPIALAADVARDGFLNIHEAPNIQYREPRSAWRADVETALSRLVWPTAPTISPKLNRLRPKSAVFEVDFPADFAYRHVGGDRFGEAVAVLQTSVYGRTTFTPHDSGAVLNADETRLHYIVRPLEDGRAFIAGPYGEYLEAQVWGEIRPRDVAEYWVPRGTPKEAYSPLSATGAPVYAYEVSNAGDRYRRVRAERLA